MFEHEQTIVDNLLSTNEQFRRLYEKHTTLKSQVKDANFGVVAMDTFSLENLKKEKLMLKDQMAEMIKDYHQISA